MTLDEVEAEAPGICRDINFDPLMLPVALHRPTILSSALDPRSIRNRSQDERPKKKEPSVITPSEVQK